MITDRVGDFIIRLKNAAMSGKREVALPHSAHLEAIARKLRELGYLAEVDVARDGAKKTLSVALAFDEAGRARMRGAKRVSKPGRRLYASSREAHGVKNGIGARILSTPQGIMSDKEARMAHAGGEDLFEIW